MVPAQTTPMAPDTLQARVFAVLDEYHEEGSGGGGLWWIVVGDVWSLSKLRTRIRQARHEEPGLEPRCLGEISGVPVPRSVVSGCGHRELFSPFGIVCQCKP